MYIVVRGLQFSHHRLPPFGSVLVIVGKKTYHAHANTNRGRALIISLWPVMRFEGDTVRGRKEFGMREFSLSNAAVNIIDLADRLARTDITIACTLGWLVLQRLKHYYFTFISTYGYWPMLKASA